MASNNRIEVATAYVTIVPSMQGSQQTISKEMGAAAGVAGTEAGQIAGKNFGESLKGTGAKMSRAGGTLTKTVTLPFVAASAAAINAASDFDENLNKVDVAFGASADRVKAWSETATEQFGLSRNAALEITSQFGDMGTSMGLTDDAAADMSISLAGLAGDLSSFKNISSDEALTALNGIFTGETESLKRLGVVMTQANLKQFAADQGLVYDEMSQAELVTLRYNYVLQQTANAQGDYSRTSDGTANSMRTFQSSVENLGIAFGQNLLPVITPLIQAGTKLVDGFGKLSPAAQKTILVVGGVAAAAGPLLSIGGKITTGIGSLAGTFGKLSGKLGGLGEGIGGIAGKLGGLGSAGSSAAGGVSAASSSFSQMGGQALLLVAAGAAVLMIAAGIKILADSAIALAAAGPGAVGVLVLLAATAVGMTAGIVAIGNAATVSAAGLLALGAAVLMVSAGIALVVLSLTLFVQQLPTIATYGEQSALALVELAGGMALMTAGAALLTVGLVALLVPLGAFVVELGLLTVATGAFTLAAAAESAAITLLAGGLTILTAATAAYTVAANGAATASTIYATGLGLVAAGVLMTTGAEAALTAIVLAATVAIVAGSAANVVWAASFVAVTAALALLTPVLLLFDGQLALMAASLALVSDALSGIAETSSAAANDMTYIVSSVSSVTAALTGLQSLAEQALAAVEEAFDDSGADIAFSTNITFQRLLTESAGTAEQINTVWATGLTTWATATKKTLGDVEKAVSTSLTKIATAFSGTRLSFAKHIPLPHFSMAGSFNAQTGSVPSVSVQWYRDAAIQGARFASPRLIGVGDASQPELLIGENTLYDSIEQAAGGAAGGDIVIPVTIGGETIDTIVVKAQQRANFRSGGR